jgi:hypothetical protein
MMQFLLEISEGEEKIVSICEGAQVVSLAGDF